MFFPSDGVSFIGNEHLKGVARKYYEMLTTLQEALRIFGINDGPNEVKMIYIRRFYRDKQFTYLKLAIAIAIKLIKVNYTTNTYINTK